MTIQGLTTMTSFQPLNLPRRAGLQALTASLLGAIGFSALMSGSAVAEQGYEGLCTLDGSTVTCVGIQAATGVNVGDIGVTLLEINSLSGNIVPAYGTPGVVLDTTSPATGNINLGAYAIEVTGEGADGIYVSAWGDNTNATLTLTGDVDSQHARGVVVTGSGTVVSDTTGDISALGDALTVKSWGGSVDLDHVGNLTSLEGKGIYAEGLGNDIYVDGNIDSLGDGIYSHSWDGGATALIVEGNITAREGSGIVAEEDAGEATVDVAGNIAAHVDGIKVTAIGDVTIDHTGNLTTDVGIGIYGKSSDGSVEITHDGGSFTAHGDGIVADARGYEGAVTVNVTGNLTSDAGRGIVATTSDGTIELNLGGSTTAKKDAIWAKAGGGGNLAIDIDSNGNIVSYDERGIYAETSGEGITADSKTFGIRIDQDGDVTAKKDAVTAVATNSNIYIDVGGSVESYDGRGVSATSSNGLVDLAVADDIISKLDAIVAHTDNGTIEVRVDNVTSYSGKGIGATSDNGALDLYASGSIISQLTAINAQTDSGNVSVIVDGGLTSYSGKGVFASSDDGTVGVTIVGDVTGQLDAITAQSDGGAINVEVTGELTSNAGKGIIAETNSGTVIVLVGDLAPVKISNLTSKLDAITARSDDSAVTVGVTGNLTSYDGKGVFASSDAGVVIVDIGGDVVTKLDAINAQSDSSAVTVDVGGNLTSYSGKGISAASDAGAVSVTVEGTLTSKLDAITARSTGGADGTVTVDVAGRLVSYSGLGIDASSTGGAVTVVTAGVETELDAIRAASLGGDNVSKVSVTNTEGAIVSYKGSGIVASSAREGITIVNTASLIAELDGISATSTGDTETSDVRVEQTGNVTVAKGTGIHVAALVDGEIVLDGDVTGGTYSIHATSLRGEVEVSTAVGNTISGASEGGAYLNSFTTATLTNRGNLSSASGLAFEFDGLGTGLVDNYGTMSGNFTFNEGAGTFNNRVGATLNAGTVLSFLGGGTLNNDGLMSLSTGLSDSVPEDSFLTGNYNQSSTGTLLSDIRFSDNASDRLVVSGTAALAGFITVNVEDLDGGILKDFKLLTAADGLTLGELSLSNPTLDATIFAENGTDAILRIEDIDFGPEGLGDPVVPTGTYVEEVFKAGLPEELKPLYAALLSTPDLETYEQALGQLSPEQYAQEMLNISGQSLNFSNRMLSCRVADGDNRFKAEGDCDWFGTRVSVLEQDETDDMTAFEQTFATLEAGTQRRLDDSWRLGGAIGLTSASTSSSDGSSVEATQGQAGVVIKYDADALLLASTLTGGYGIHASERNVSIGQIDDTLVGDAQIAYLSARFHGAYTFDMGTAYIKPLFNLDLTATHFGGVTETGGATALTVDAGTQYIATINPAIEFGGEITDSSGTLIRPFVQIGLEASVSSDLALAARFSGVDPSIGSFSISQPDAEPQAKLSLGADVLTTDNATIRVYYDGSIGASSRKNGLGLKISGTLE